MTLEIPNALRIPVAVVAERRKAATRWADWSWRVVEVLEDAADLPDLPPWTVLREAEGRTLFLAGRAEVALYPTDTTNYRDNLMADPPRVWVVLRPIEAGYRHVAERLAGMRERARYPREDVMRWVDAVRALEVARDEHVRRFEAIDARIDATNDAIRISDERARAQERALDAKLDRVLVELERTIARVSEDRELVGDGLRRGGKGGVRDHLVGGIAVVDRRLEGLGGDAGDGVAGDATDQLLALSREHRTDDDLDPPLVVPPIHGRGA